MNPAAQARGFTVLFVAVAAVIAVVLVALLISNLGGSDAPPGTSGSRTTTGLGTGLTPVSSATLPPTGQTPGANATTAAGLVPNVKGQNASQAKQTLENAGYVVKESRKKDDAARGTVVDQAPAGSFPLAAGQSVIIVVSDGP